MVINKFAYLILRLRISNYILLKKMSETILLIFSVNSYEHKATNLIIVVGFLNIGYMLRYQIFTFGG